MNVWRRDVKLSNLMGEKPTKLSDPLQYWNIWLPTECEDVLSDREFKTLAGEKGRIISAIKKAVEKEKWVWMVIDEEPDRVVVELRRCKRR